ncbi:hypothetical protein D9757_011418 [Collybiopsis confluens]|uniref:Nephrocystin 3-like N-terminal domain-containing protein n=1 Tax=Collybiopsis confluens TaxID=2823264 RepID=A0A8H5LK75_9AGAR|nr:hypothetical protein D9757_011418 [Collybiopsis confluens]
MATIFMHTQSGAANVFHNSRKIVKIRQITRQVDPGVKNPLYNTSPVRAPEQEYQSANDSTRLMEEQKRSQSQPSSARGRKRDKLLDFFHIKSHSRSPAPSVGSEGSSHPGTPGTPQTRVRKRNKIFLWNYFGSHPPSPTSESPASTFLQTQHVPEQVPENQEGQVWAPFQAADVGSYGQAVVFAAQPNTLSPTAVGQVMDNDSQGHAITGTSGQVSGDQSQRNAILADAASSPNTETVLDNDHHQAGLSTSAADKVLNPVEYIAPATPGENESNGESTMSQVRKVFLESWKGLHQVTELIEPLLAGTPFKTPLVVFNTISKIAETNIDNQDKMQQLFQDIKDYLEMVNEALMQGMRKNRGHGFAKFLVDQTLKLYNMQSQNIIKQVIVTATISQHLQDMVAGLDKECQKIQTRLQFYAQIDSRMDKMFREWPVAKNAAYNASVRHDICTPETRMEILSRLGDWISDSSSDSPSIFWIRGMAGMGKSTIAKTICEKYSSRVGDCQLGASFFCSRQSAELRSQQNVIPTIVYQLGRRSDTFWDTLARVDEDAVNDAKRHVSRILFEPWSKKTPKDSSRWLIVIDALDELDGYGGSQLVEQLLKGISKTKMDG